MTKNNDKTSGGNPFLAGYGLQVLVAPALAGILLAIFFWGFGYDADLLWTNVLILAVWLILVQVTFLRRPDGEFWRNYRWIISPAVLILLFLFNTSWAQSTLTILSLKKSVFKTTSLDSAQIHVEYPSQILFDDTGPSEVRLWTTGSSHCPSLVISGEGLLFAVKPPSDAPLEWSEKLPLEFNGTTTAITLLVQPSQPPGTNSQITQLNLNSGGNHLETQNWQMVVESKRDSQIRGWKKNFLSTGSTIVSLITAIFVGIKQLEEEKKRQQKERVKQIISNFSSTKNNLSQTLQEYLGLKDDWREWDKALQREFREAYTAFVEGALWDVLPKKTTTEMAADVNLYLQVSERIFEGSEEKLISTLKKLQSALLQDDHASLNLLAMLKEYPASINIAKIIASAFPPGLKKKTIDDYTSKFLDQIRDLRVELDFPDFESFPLQRQFSFYTKDHTFEDRLNVWLETHELDCSPFADADSPFYSVLNGRLLIDADMAPPGFMLPKLNAQNQILEFSNSWDAGAGLFAYCNALKSNTSLKDAIFFSIITPSLIENYGMDHTRKLYLHALAEQWIWSLAETPTLFYSLQSEQRDLVGRLIRWHDISPSITAHKNEKFAGRLQEKEKKRQAFPLSGLTAWLSEKDAADLRTEEINALIELQPYPKRSNLFLVPTIDLNPQVERQISGNLHEKLAEQFDWLSAHNSKAVIFSMSAKNRQVVILENLVNQCKIRTRKCSNDKLEFNQLFDAPGSEPDKILARKANGSPGRMVRLGQKLLLQHVEKYPPDDEDNYKYLHIEDLEALQA